MSARDVASLPVVQLAQSRRSAEWHAAARKARWLSWLSLVWMGAEGAIALSSPASSPARSL